MLEARPHQKDVLKDPCIAIKGGNAGQVQRRKWKKATCEQSCLAKGFYFHQLFLRDHLYHDNIC